jgi:hypothetical protein
LRIEREQQDAVAALRLQPLNRRSDGGLAVAHGPVDLDTVSPSHGRGDLVGLGPGDGLQRRFVEFAVPDALVGMAAALRPAGEHDAVEDEPPHHGIDLDHPAIGQKFLEVAPHRPVGRTLRRAQVDEQHPDLAEGNGGMPGGQSDSRVAMVYSRLDLKQVGW